MASRLQRKSRRNKVVAKQRTEAIQRLQAKPVIKNVDIEKEKEGFSAK